MSNLEQLKVGLETDTGQLFKNNTEKRMFLLILLKRSHRPHPATKQELVQQMSESSSLLFPQKYTQTQLFFLEKSVSQVSKETSLEDPFSWGMHKHVAALQTGKAEHSVCVAVQPQDWAFTITILHHD